MDLSGSMSLLPQNSTVVALMTTLRDTRTNSDRFRDATLRLGRLLAAQALAEQETHPHEVATPLERAAGLTRRGGQALVPILRAGQSLVGPFCELMVDPQVWHLGLSRDHVTLQPREYMCAVPGRIAPETDCTVLDPMLATGGSADYAVRGA